MCSRTDADNDGHYTDAGSYTHYALTDHQFSVVALISSSGRLIERVSYDGYGTAQHHWMQDVDGDGDIDANDESLITNASGNAIYQSGYNVDADFNRDGVINSTDTAEVTSSSYAAAIRAGWLSASNVGNTIGYCGYVFNPEHGGSGAGIYTVRFRHFDPMWGRWLERDPLGYLDSMSLHGYGWGSPTGNVDPSGTMYIPPPQVFKYAWDWLWSDEPAAVTVRNVGGMAVGVLEVGAGIETMAAGVAGSAFTGGSALAVGLL